MDLQYVLEVEPTALSKGSNRGKDKADVKHDISCPSPQKQRGALLLLAIYQEDVGGRASFEGE